MNVEINGKSLELSFGFKFLREIDNRLGLKLNKLLSVKVYQCCL
ncbi:phi 11 orf40 [Staphylococcus aureus]|uniref:Phi 11 orf40 n=1 Tax=Staphylococcus aureus TaxID=1280 RepID=A0A380EHJ1_STAAU|nr:phi 11 orf40 [Staphylococcus aureus]